MKFMTANLNGQNTVTGVDLSTLGANVLSGATPPKMLFPEANQVWKEHANNMAVLRNVIYTDNGRTQVNNGAIPAGSSTAVALASAGKLQQLPEQIIQAANTAVSGIQMLDDLMASTLPIIQMIFNNPQIQNVILQMARSNQLIDGGGQPLNEHFIQQLLTMILPAAANGAGNPVIQSPIGQTIMQAAASTATLVDYAQIATDIVFEYGPLAVSIDNMKVNGGNPEALTTPVADKFGIQFPQTISQQSIIGGQAIPGIMSHHGVVNTNPGVITNDPVANINNLLGGGATPGVNDQQYSLHNYNNPSAQQPGMMMGGIQPGVQPAMMQPPMMNTMMGGAQQPMMQPSMMMGVGQPAMNTMMGGAQQPSMMMGVGQPAMNTMMGGAQQPGMMGGIQPGVQPGMMQPPMMNTMIGGAQTQMPMNTMMGGAQQPMMQPSMMMGANSAMGSSQHIAQIIQQAQSGGGLSLF